MPMTKRSPRFVYRLLTGSRGIRLSDLVTSQMGHMTFSLALSCSFVILRFVLILMECSHQSVRIGVSLILCIANKANRGGLLFPPPCVQISRQTPVKESLLYKPQPQEQYKYIFTMPALLCPNFTTLFIPSVLNYLLISEQITKVSRISCSQTSLSLP